MPQSRHITARLSSAYSARLVEMLVQMDRTILNSSEFKRSSLCFLREPQQKVWGIFDLKH